MSLVVFFDSVAPFAFIAVLAVMFLDAFPMNQQYKCAASTLEMLAAVAEHFLFTDCFTIFNGACLFLHFLLFLCVFFDFFFFNFNLFSVIALSCF